MKYIIFLICLLYIPFNVFSISARNIIRLIDRNKNARTSRFFAKMIIKKGNRKLVKEFNGYGKKAGDKFFMIFTNPEDRGIKYLKLKKSLWIYFPDADDVLKISGHMLRKGMMGSDISYEDLLNYDDLDKKYRSVLKGQKIIRGRQCYDIVITAKVPNVTYYKQRILVDKTRYVLMKMHMFAKSGRLLKTMRYLNIKNISGYYLPMKIEVIDKRRKNTVTTVIYNRMRLNLYVPAITFTKRNLQR